MQDYFEESYKKLVFLVFQMLNAGFEPLITNDFSPWAFPNNFGVNLKDDKLDEPHSILELQILSCHLSSESFEYWDDEFPSVTVEGIIKLYVKLVNENGTEAVNKTTDMPVSFSMVNYEEWQFDSFISNYTCNLKNDIELQINSPKQSIVLSTYDRIRRMKRLLFQTWEFD